MTTSPVVLTYDQEGKEGGHKKGKGTAWSQIISLLVWPQEIMEYSQAIVNGLLFRKLLVVQ